MSFLDFAVIVSAIALIALLAWFFFGPKPARLAQLVGDRQVALVAVKGGYSPDLIRVRSWPPTCCSITTTTAGELGAIMRRRLES